MGFSNRSLTFLPTRSGLCSGNNHTVATAKHGDWENVAVGRFVFNKAGKITTLDGTAAPLLLGLALRNITDVVDDSDRLNALTDTLEYCTSGLVTVEVASSQTAPLVGTPLFVNNKAGDANLGKVQTGASDGVKVNCFFREAKSATVWLVELKMGQVA